ncbi:endonuclease/exonuclease/phosphatase family protein [bacterium]|nr:endonuclease/exonuclease/phosphatase family protein [bacterium]
MTPENKTLRIGTYNIHKARGLDGRIRPDRILSVLKAMDADVIALQEVVSNVGKTPEENQSEYFAKSLGMYYCIGENRKHKGGIYGNATLSRFPIINHKNHDISVHGRERRGVLRADIEFDESLLHVFNVHLGTAFLERRSQVRTILTSAVLLDENLEASRILLGDFNEWIRGLASKMLSERMLSADVKAHLKRRKTYPGFFPLLHLDHVYFDPPLKLQRLSLVRNRTSMIASDHLPLIADFVMNGERGL